MIAIIAAASLAYAAAAAAGEPAQIQPLASAVLRAGTPVFVTTSAEISTKTSKVGDRFDVTVARDVVAGPTVVIPQGTTGHGEVTFATRKGAFGKPGIVMISLRYLDLGGKQIALDGRYREEGGNNAGATAVTMFAVGILAGAIQGKHGGIPAGRELRARTGQDIAFLPSTEAAAHHDQSNSK